MKFKKILFKLVRMPLSWEGRKFLSKLINIIKINKATVNVSDLNEVGYRYIKSFVDGSVVSKIVQELDNCKLFDQWDKSVGNFTLSNVPESCHVGNYAKQDIMAVDEIQKIVFSPELKEIAETYLGGRAYLTDVSVWWSFGGKKAPQEAELFHRDLDNLLWLKFFIYLTDVDNSSGPHVFIPHSHKSKKKLKFQRFTDEEATDLFGKPIIFIGNRGDLIIEDTFGLHKGQFISSCSRRLILQFQYAALPKLY